MRWWLVLVVACDSSSHNKHVPIADVNPRPADAFDSATCLVDAHYGSIAGSAIIDGAPMHPTFTIAVSSSPVDNILITLFENPAGTYAMSADLGVCNPCVQLLAGISNGTPNKRYQALAGTLTYDNVSAPLHGTATGLTFYALDPTGTMIRGCITDVGTLTFTAN